MKSLLLALSIVALLAAVPEAQAQFGVFARNRVSVNANGAIRARGPQGVAAAAAIAGGGVNVNVGAVRQNVVVQRQFAHHHAVQQQVVVQRQYAYPVVQQQIVQRVYAQPVVQQFHAYPVQQVQAVYAAPIVQRVEYGHNCQQFFQSY